MLQIEERDYGKPVVSECQAMYVITSQGKLVQYAGSPPNNLCGLMFECAKYILNDELTSCMFLKFTEAELAADLALQDLGNVQINDLFR